MKKAILLFILFFCLNNYSRAQVDGEKAANDTNTLGHNKVYNKHQPDQDSINNKMNKDSINNKKKMPPKKTNGTSLNFELRIKDCEFMEFNNPSAFLIHNS